MDKLELKVTDKDIQSRFNWEEVLQKNKAVVSLGLAGLVLLLAGIFWATSLTKSPDKIEIIPSEKTEKTAKNIFADVEGAVIKPGVYEIPDGSRVNDLLIVAGGISMDADREWVEKNLNKAQKLTDGMKIYIPSKGEVISKTELKTNVVSSEKININVASLGQLDTLWGVGPVTAQKIIDNRPYGRIEELVSKKVVSKSVFERIKEQISVY